MSARITVGELGLIYHARCKFCGRRWRLEPDDPIPGKELACPECALDGATVVMDYEPQVELL